MNVQKMRHQLQRGSERRPRTFDESAYAWSSHGRPSGMELLVPDGSWYGGVSQGSWARDYDAYALHLHLRAFVRSGLGNRD